MSFSISQVAERFKTIFNNLISSPTFLSYLKELNIDSFSFELLSPKYKNEFIDIKSKAYSKDHGSNLMVLAGVTSDENKTFSLSSFKKALQQQLSFVVIDKRNGKLVGGWLNFDCFQEDLFKNEPLWGEKSSLIDTLYVEWMNKSQFYKENVVNVFKHNYKVKKGLIKAKPIPFKYGEIFKSDVFLERKKKYFNIGLFPTMFAINFAILSNMNLKYFLHDMAHPSTVYFGKYKIPKLLKNVNAQSFIGSELNFKKFIKQQLENNNAFYVKNVNQQILDKMDDNVHLSLVISEWSNTWGKYDAVHAFQLLNDRIKTKSKL